MKPLLFIFLAFLSTGLFAQPIQLENLTYGKKDSRNIFIGDNIFKVVSKEPIVRLKYDTILTDAQLHQDTLTIHPIYTVHLPERKSNWEGKNDELTISFLTATGKEDIKFYLKKLPYAFPAIMTQPANAKVDKESLISSKKVEIITATPDQEGFFKNYKVQEFELLINNKSYKVSENELNKDVVAAIKRAQSGDKITLQQVQTINYVTNRKLNFIGPTIYVLK